MLALVFVAHAVLLGYFSLPFAPTAWGPKLTPGAGVLRVRFYFSNVEHRRPVVMSTRLTKAIRSGTKTYRPTRASTVQEKVVVQAKIVPQAVVLITTDAPARAPATVSSGDNYVAGGGAFQHGSEVRFRQQNGRIPGTSFVSHAPNFRTVDPRMQGLSGAVRFIGRLAGAVDSHCLDLSAWQGMTPAERIAHHLSSDEMEKIADQYNCQPRAVL